MRVALITGGSRGLGLSLARALVKRDWQLIVDGRDAGALLAAAAELTASAGRTTPPVVAIPGDVADPGHRHDLLDAVAEVGRLDLLVNNASVLGPSPQPDLENYPLDDLRHVFEVNALAPLGLVQLALPWLRAGDGCLVNITSDAAVEAYPGWGGYGSSKAALERLTHVLMQECPGLHIYLADPGDLRTQMHQEAFPGEDISDRPLPEVAVPGLLALAEGNLPNGRYRLQDHAHWATGTTADPVGGGGRLAEVVDLAAMATPPGSPAGASAGAVSDGIFCGTVA